jgi:iron(III) transport system permease protein
VISTLQSRRRPRISGLQVVVAAIGLFVAGTVLITLGRLAVWAWDEYGTGIPSFYVHNVFGNVAVRHMLMNTVIAVVVSSALATGVAAILAWLNERTDASIGLAGSILPLVPFLMPAIALPLGWLFLASPQAGLLNIAIRGGLRRIGLHLDSGPFNIYSWPAMIFLYTVFLCGFAYLVIASSMRTLDRGLEEAAKLAGARPPRILFRIVLPALRPALFSAFLMCLIVAVVMVSVPITIGPASNITILSVQLVDLITTQSPPEYGQAFLLGLLLLVPVLLAWWLQFRSAARGRFAVIGGKVGVGQKLQLGHWRLVGRGFFLGYVLVAVVFPLLGLLYVAGLDFWSSVWPPQSWHLVKNIRAAVEDPVIRTAIKNSVMLGLGTGAVLIAAAHLVAYAQRLFPTLGRVVDVLTKIPAVVAQILIAIALLVTLGAPPFQLSSGWLLFIGYLVVFLPFASVIATGAQHQIGRDIVEAAKISNSSDLRTFSTIVTPLARPALVAGFLLMYVLVSGETNVSLILASTQRPVVGFVMLDLFNFASYPKVASFALVITVVNLTCIAVFMRLLTGRSRLGVR